MLRKKSDRLTQEQVDQKLPELVTLERLLKTHGSKARVNIEAVVPFHGYDFPIHSVVMGSEDKTAPTLAFFGGVHGLERIGSQVVLAWLQTIFELLEWDMTLAKRLSESRILFMPIVNPVGMFLRRRSNANGVDLMRNSPILAEDHVPFLLGGHTISNLLPWYRGKTDHPDLMEDEAKALCDFARREMFPSKKSMSIDVHSGFGSVDRLWFPFAKSLKPPKHLAEIVALKRLFDRSYPSHPYQIEPQAVQYTTHGDLWDWLYEMRTANSGFFMPWSLELGSWMWLRKNPRQVFSSLGGFNPLKPHRLQRVLRRHYTLFDFLHRVLLSSERWLELSPGERKAHQGKGFELWYKE
jgi:hypothetical protein